ERWFHTIVEHKTESSKKIKRGFFEYWKHIGYSSEDEYFFDHFGKNKQEFFEERASEYLSYRKFFELLIFLAKNIDGEDHRTYLVTSQYEKNHLLSEWFKEL